MADEKNAPGAPPQAAQQATLKEIRISGTDLVWRLGESHKYRAQEGEDTVEKVSAVIGMGVMIPPAHLPNGQPNPEAGWAQVNILYEDGYRDLFTCADHLVIKNLHISAIAVVQGPKLVVPGR